MSFADRRAEALAYLETLYGKPRGGDDVVLFTLPGACRVRFPLAELDRAAHEGVQASLEPGTNVYLTSCLLTPASATKGGRGRAEDAALFPGVWADIDIAGPAHKSDALPPSWEMALEIVAGMVFPPTLIVDSGHGMYPWWLFERPTTLRDELARARAHKLVRGAQEALRTIAGERGWTIDPTDDLARVLRLPGSTNWKLDDDPRPVRMLEHTGKRYRPEELIEAWSNLAPDRTTGAAAPMPERITAGGRTKSVESLAGTMLRRNIVESAAVVAALEHNRLVCDPPLGDAKVRQTVKGIYHRYPPGPPPVTGANGTSSNGKRPSAAAHSWAELVPLAKIERRPIKFLWEPAIIRGGITLLAGDPGKGKGLIASMVAAGVSAGVELPGHQAVKGAVLWVTFEEAWEFAIAPRLDVAGCDEARVYKLVIHREDADERRLTRADIPLLREVLVANPEIVLVVLDPVLGFVSGETNINQQNEVRDALNPVVDIADDLGIAVLGLMHVNKSELTKTLYRVSNSIAFAALARSILGVGELDDGRRVLGQIKTSYSEALIPVPFTIVGVGHPATKQSVGRIIWEEPDPEIDVARIFEDRKSDKKKGPTKAAECAKRLESLLADGPMFVGAVKRTLAVEGFGKDTVEDAADIAQVETIGRGRSARWTMPGGPISHVTPTPPSEATTSEVDLTESDLRVGGGGPPQQGDEEGDA